MERLTEKNELFNDNILKTEFKYKANVFEAIIEANKKENTYYIWHSAIDKLAEYENTRLTPQEISNLKHELEVYKRALDSTSNILEQKYMFAQDDKSRKIIPLNEYFLYQARKELEDER